MKKTILLVGAGLVGLILLVGGNKIKEFLYSVKFYISSIGIPEFSNGFLKVPVYLSIVNHSALSVTIDQIITSFYKYDTSGWTNIGISDPRQEPIKIKPNQTTNIKIEPRISILQGLVTSLMALMREGGIRYRIGVTLQVAGTMLPEQFEEFQIGQVR